MQPTATFEQSRKTIHVGMPLYNPDDEFPDTLASVERQTRLPDRVIASDDYSKKHAHIAALETSSLNVELIRHEKNQGMWGNFLEVLTRSDADYFVFLAQDDRWQPTYLEELAKALDADPDAVVAFSGIELTRDGKTMERYAPAGMARGQRVPERQFIADFFRGKRINDSVYYGLWRRKALISIFKHIDSFGETPNEKLPVMLGYLSGPMALVPDILFIKSHDRRRGSPALGGDTSNADYARHLSDMYRRQSRIIMTFGDDAARRATLLRHMRWMLVRKVVRKAFGDRLLRSASRLKRAIVRS